MNSAASAWPFCPSAISQSRPARMSAIEQLRASGAIKVAKAVGHNDLLQPENPDHSTASISCGGYIIAPEAHLSCQSERRDDGKCCEAPRLRRDQLDRGWGGEVGRNDPESADAPLAPRNLAVALAVLALW